MKKNKYGRVFKACKWLPRCGLYSKRHRELYRDRQMNRKTEERIFEKEETTEQN